MTPGLLTEENRDAGYIAVYRRYYRDQLGNWQTLALEVQFNRERHEYQLELGESYEKESPQFSHLRNALIEGLGTNLGQVQ